MENETKKVMETGDASINEMLLGQQLMFKLMFSFVDSMALKCAVELRIADIMHSNGHPITLRQIISSMNPPTPDIAYLERVMRFLVNRKIFTAKSQSDGGETLYGPTIVSRWIQHDAELSLAPLVLLQNDERMLAPWHHLKACLCEGGDSFEKAHGLGMWEYGSHNPSFFKLFNEAMQCTATLTSKLITNVYKDEFDHMDGSIMDIGGGTGAALAGIIKAHPRIKGINFDLPHVVATAPKYPGVSHVGGDMFETIPTADIIFMKSTLHGWSEEDCIRILKNCRKSIPESTGKLILVEVVLSSEENEQSHSGMVIDLLMMTHHDGGKERNDREWKALLDKAGFTRMNIIKLPFELSIIEAYPF